MIAWAFALLPTFPFIWVAAAAPRSGAMHYLDEKDSLASVDSRKSPVHPRIIFSASQRQIHRIEKLPLGSSQA